MHTAAIYENTPCSFNPKVQYATVLLSSVTNFVTTGVSSVTKIATCLVSFLRTHPALLDAECVLCVRSLGGRKRS